MMNALLGFNCLLDSDMFFCYVLVLITETEKNVMDFYKKKLTCVSIARVRHDCVIGTFRDAHQSLTKSHCNLCTCY